MKSKPPTPEAMVVFDKIQLAGLGVLLLALIPWLAQDFVAGLAATRATTHARLRTTEEQNDDRVLRAFRLARQRTRIDATLETERNPQQQTRDSLLVVTANSKSEALADLATMTNAVKANFNQEGPGELFLIDQHPYAEPVASEKSALLRQVCRWAALLFLVGGLVMIFKAWRRSGLPLAALLGILATIGGTALYLMGTQTNGAIWGALFLVGIPILILVLVTRLTLKVRRAASWVEGRARITSSGVEVERHRFAGEATKVKNRAAVTYEFTVGSRTVHGDSISLGAAPADNVDITLKRYPEGAEVPVFYDPAHPEDCTLERKPPASLGCIWSGTLGGILLYALVVFSFWNGESISGFLEKTFPTLHHPVAVIVCGLFGLFCFGSFLWNRRHPRKTEPWSSTKGVVVSSATETYRQIDTSSSHTEMRLYEAVIEYSYKVEGQEYHNVMKESGGSQDRADAEVARHPVGQELDVYYDPSNPTRSALKPRPEIMLTGRASLVVGVVLLGLAFYLASH